MDKVVRECEIHRDKVSFAGGANDREAHQERWIAVLVQVNCERKVADRLSRLGYETYVPVQKEVHQWSDRKKKIDRIVIPMVVFVRVDKEREKILRTYSFIFKFLSYPGEKAAASIPDVQIANLKFMLRNADSRVEVTDTTFEVGEDVEIVRGPLKGLCGELCFFESGNPMVGIYLDLFGYVCVNVNKSDIKSKTN